MNFFHRISVCAVVCGAVACGKNGADSIAPVGESETVIIGCTGTGAEIEVRTQIDDDLSVRWVSGDEIRFWAREHGESAFLAAVRNIPFRFDYYSPKWSRAGFTGTIVGVTDVFDAGKQYDYYAVSPAPAAESDIDGTRVAYTVPDVQDGSFDGRCDILTARLEQAPALQKGDNNPAVDLNFTHHLHAMKFVIPQNALGEKISAIELTFPRPVVGRMVVDITGETADDFSGLDRDKLTIDFPKGEEKDAGDTFFAMVAPIAFDSGERIGMRIIGTTGETSVDYTFARPTSFVAEHLTPVMLYVPAMNTYYTVVEFSVVDNDRAEHAGKANLFGVNTLGERVQTVRLKGEAGAFANAVRMSNGCSVSDDGSVLTCAIADNETDGHYELMFVSRKDAGSKCPWEKWNSSAFSGKTLEVEYESESALIKSQEGWKPVQTTAPTIQDGRINTMSALSVPYLFEEDFGGLTGSNGRDEGTIMLSDYGMPANGWSISRYMIAEGRVACFVYVGSSTGMDIKHGRLDSPFLPLNASADVSLAVSYDIGGARIGGAALFGSSYWVSVCEFGTDTREGTLSGNESIEKRCCSFTPDVGGSLTSDDLPMSRMELVENCTAPIRLSWRADYKKESHTGTAPTVTSKDFPIYIDNIKVSIAH